MFQLVVFSPDVHFRLEFFEIKVKSGPMDPWDLNPFFLDMLALDLVLDGDSHHSFKPVAQLDHEHGDVDVHVIGGMWQVVKFAWPSFCYHGPEFENVDQLNSPSEDRQLVERDGDVSDYLLVVFRGVLKQNRSRF